MDLIDLNALRDEAEKLKSDVEKLTDKQNRHALITDFLTTIEPIVKNFEDSLNPAQETPSTPIESSTETETSSDTTSTESATTVPLTHQEGEIPPSDTPSVS